MTFESYEGVEDLFKLLLYNYFYCVFLDRPQSPYTFVVL